MGIAFVLFSTTFMMPYSHRIGGGVFGMTFQKHVQFIVFGARNVPYLIFWESLENMLLYFFTF